MGHGRGADRSHIHTGLCPRAALTAGSAPGLWDRTLSRGCSLTRGDEWIFAPCWGFPPGVLEMGCTAPKLAPLALLSACTSLSPPQRCTSVPSIAPSCLQPPTPPLQLILCAWQHQPHGLPPVDVDVFHCPSTIPWASLCCLMRRQLEFRQMPWNRPHTTEEPMEGAP